MPTFEIRLVGLDVHKDSIVVAAADQSVNGGYATYRRHFSESFGAQFLLNEGVGGDNAVSFKEKRHASLSACFCVVPRRASGILSAE
jgi:hypothetical protein